MSRTNKVHRAPAVETTVKPWTYTDEQIAKIESLREYAKEQQLPESDDYHVWEKRWLEKPDTVPRYMRAAKWKLDDAKKRLKATLEWRREYKPDLIPPDEVKIESETGKILLNGFDKDGRPIIYMRPGRENTEQSPRQLRHLVWWLERAKDMQPPGVESITIIVDYKSTTLRTNPSIGTARKVLHILQGHYPETLGRGLVVNMPGILAFFYKGIAPFLDPVTRDKIRFNPDLLELIPAEQLDADFGGEFEYEFEPESYWSQIVDYCGITPDGTRVHQPTSSKTSGSDEADSKAQEKRVSSDSSSETAVPSPESPDTNGGLADKVAKLDIGEKHREEPQIYRHREGLVSACNTVSLLDWFDITSASIMSSVVVLGGGVVGLSTALKIQEKGYPVTIVAETFPDDKKNIRYTSPWAGAHHVSFAHGDEKQQKIDRETFDVMWEMSEPGKDSEKSFLRIPQTEYYGEKLPFANCLEVMPNFRNLKEDELIPGTAAGITFNTFTIDMPVYLLYLVEKFRSLGGRTQRDRIQHIAQLAEGTYTDGKPPAAIVICAGLEARYLGGVEDSNVFPVRGQTVVLRAPWIQFGRTVSDFRKNLWTYIIPRRCGHVIVGGTRDANDWEPKPREATSKDILERGLALCPELSSTYAQDKSKKPTIEDVKPIIVEEGCGLRPQRKGGIRLETDTLQTVTGVKVPLVYNYGHGGFGVQSSWGSARIASELLEGVLQKKA
ncbi:hypothetical protein ACEPAH_1113 [Sanghuangporus vaninii]